MFEINGTSVRLRLYGDRIEINDLPPFDGIGTRLVIPLRRCVTVNIDERRARDGSGALWLELGIDLGRGRGDSLAGRLIFPDSCRAQLHHLASLIQDRALTATPSPTLGRLAVVEAPDTDEWLAFRPLPAITEVLAATESP